MGTSRGALILVVLAGFALGGPMAATAGHLAGEPQGQSQQFPAPQFPPFSDDGRNGPPVIVNPHLRRDPQLQLKEAQKKISVDVEHLLQLAKELKDESDKTKETEVLSLPLIRKTQEIEKLAKQIRDLARSN